MRGSIAMKCKNCPFTLSCYTNSWGKSSTTPKHPGAVLDITLCANCGLVVMDISGRAIPGEDTTRWILNCEKRTSVRAKINTFLEKAASALMPDPLGGTIYVMRHCYYCTNKKRLSAVHLDYVIQ